ncbi:sulfur carrier protein ThiS [Salinicoccus roseus]|jgi:sulfur carrier protein|uniref:sulfur carrier protein ThiS n=1 Tax=Salinicoccus TaxID=45669 RepID=UPI0004E1D5C7|nr:MULTISPECIES: sulfur carrier protein ThiS [Salinicoccus]MBY8909940.1 sulfur carrier protein ThiS [Salinicoccus roseus]MCG7332487.1 sulfur carrier protein ThiS [Salinicoccus roseus]
MECRINGDSFAFEYEMSIHEVLESLELDHDRIIVEHNNVLIKKKDFKEYIVKEADRLELLEFVGGG